MSQPQHPVRWLESDQLAPDVRSELASYAAEAPHVERRARMLTSLEQQLGFTEAPSAQAPGAQSAPPAPGGAIGAGTAATAGAVFKLKLVIGTLAAIGASLGLFVGWSAAHSVPPVAPLHLARELAARDLSARSTFRAAPSEFARWVPEVARAEQQRALDVSPAPDIAVTGPSATLTVQADREKPPRVRRPVSARLVSAHAVQPEPSGQAQAPAAVVPASADVSSGDVPSGDVPGGDAPSALGATNTLAELTLLAHARRALLAQPERSLELAEQHAREFPNGTLCEEREVLAIESLLKLGLSDRARQRALLFEQRFPSSAHRAHLARLIARPAH